MHDHLNMLCAALDGCALNLSVPHFVRNGPRVFQCNVKDKKSADVSSPSPRLKSSARKILSRSMKMMRVGAAERVAESVECRL